MSSFRSDQRVYVQPMFSYLFTPSPESVTFLPFCAISVTYKCVTSLIKSNPSPPLFPGLVSLCPYILLPQESSALVLPCLTSFYSCSHLAFTPTNPLTLLSLRLCATNLFQIVFPSVLFAASFWSSIWWLTALALKHCVYLTSAYHFLLLFLLPHWVAFQPSLLALGLIP